MATLTRNTVPIGGIDLAGALVAADVAGDEVLNDVPNAAKTFLVVENAGGGAINVTVNSQTNCSQGFDHDSVVNVPAGETHMIGPLTKARWNDPADKKVKWTYDSVTSVSVGVFELT